MSKLTREEAKLTVSQCITSDWYRGYNEAVDQLFDKHEAETAQLRMEITELRKLVAEKNELIKELEDNIDKLV